MWFQNAVIFTKYIDKLQLNTSQRSISLTHLNGRYQATNIRDALIITLCTSTVMYTNIHIEFMKNSNPTHQITKASQTVPLRLDRTVCLLGSFHKNWKESGIWLGSNLSIITNFESTFNERPGNETAKHDNIKKTRPIGDLSTKIIHSLIPLWFWQPSPC